LYGKNTFIVGFTEYYATFSPASRRKGSLPYQKDISAGPGFKRVKHWKVILPAKPHIGSKSPAEDFVKFCRALSDNTPCTLRVWILPKSRDYGDRSFGRSCGADNYDVAAILQPLNPLRNVKDIKLGELPINDLSIYQPTKHHSSPSPHEFPTGFLDNMKSLVEGSTPVKRVWKMYEKLLKYGQSFERNDRFRADMEPGWGAGEFYAQYQAEGISAWTLKNRSIRTQKPFNPFTESPTHPVEESLPLCSIGSESNETEQFLSTRSYLLSYPEPQYQRIANASFQITEFVKAEKNPGSFLSRKPTIGSEDIKPISTWAMILLEDYAQSFARGAPPSTRINIRTSQHKFDATYASLERELLLKRLSSILENDDFQITVPIKFVELFKQAVDDMDKTISRDLQSQKITV
jgi:hypothetical protein